MKHKLQLTTSLIVLLFLGGSVWGQTSYTSTSVSTAWNDSRWNNASDAAPYTAAYEANNEVNFTSGNYSFAGMGAAINVGNINVASGANVIFTENVSTFATGGNVRTITVASGSTIDFDKQSFSTAGGTGFIKEGEGTMIILTGGTFGGGFTLNAGTMIIGGVNALGSGGVLNINGGTLAAAATKTITTKYSIINIGGDFILGNTNNAFNLGFGDVVSLGSNATRTITLGSPATYSLSGAISGDNANLSLNATAAGTLVLSGANTYNGTTTVSGGTLKLALIGGNTLPASNNIVVDGGTLQISTNQTLNDLTFTNGTITIDAGIILTINGILDCGTNAISGSGLFTLSSGATLKTAHSSGLNGSIAVSGTKSFHEAANYEFNGSVAQVTGALLPATVNDLTINSAAVTLSNSAVTVNGTLLINSGKKFEIGVDKQVTIPGTLTNNAGTTGLLIKSDANGTGSLIHSTAGVAATVERHLVGYGIVSDQMFHFISSPVTTQAIREEFVTNTPTAGHDFYSFDEGSNTWINSKVIGGAWNGAFESTFTVGKGYMVAYPTDVTKNFTGILNSSEKELTCTNTSLMGNGWNLLGNPFPSAIDWTQVVKGTGMDAALYYYDNTAQQYRYYLNPIAGDENSIGGGQQYIPAMQGFMAHASTNGATLTIPTSAKTHSGQDVFYKSTNAVPGSLSLKVTANGYEDEAYIHFNQNATTAFDGSFDAYKLRSYSPSVPNLYTKGTDDSELAINGLPELEDSTVIPVYFEAATEGAHTLTANLEGLTEAVVYLEDILLNEVQNLTANPVYSFTASNGDNTDRFNLTFGAVGIGEQDQAATLNAYMVDNRLYVNNTLEKAQLAVYDLQGRLVAQQAINEAGLQSLPLNLPAGMYVLQLSNAQEAQSVKINVQ
ncbi:MAG: T9SS type A sorting domain-containing protein [Bacteroidales bacterium]|nr:T9SS type A sorting domain-containing protein [Bacteroidales bacterium]